MSVIVDDLGVRSTNLMKSDPGTVYFLLDVAEGAARLIEVVTKIPTPILYTTLAIHSFMLWGGLLTTGVVKMLSPLNSLALALGGVSKEASAVGQLGNEASGLERMKAVVSDISGGLTTFGSNLAQGTKGIGLLGKEAQASVIPLQDLRAGESMAAAEGTGLLESLAALAATPWTWVAVGTAALGVLIFELVSVKTATEKWAETLNTSLAKGTWFGTLQANMQALGQVNQRLTTQQAQLGHAMADTSNQTSTAISKYGAMVVVAHQAADGTDALRRSVGDLHREYGTLNSAQQAQISFLTGLSKSYGTSLTDSMALATLAGVKLTQVTQEGSKAYQTAVQEVANLYMGYQDMSVRGSMLANSVDAVTFATEQQDSKIQQLTQAWTAYIGMVTGGESAFATFEEQVQGLTATASGLDRHPCRYQAARSPCRPRPPPPA